MHVDSFSDGGSCDGWDVWRGARVEGSKERDCAEHVVDFGGYGERKKAELSVT
jgi:hypothetical protein